MKVYINCVLILFAVLFIACGTTKELGDYGSTNENFLDAVSQYEQVKSKGNFNNILDALKVENEKSIKQIKVYKQAKDDSKWADIISEVESILEREDRLSNLDLTDEQFESLSLFDIEGLNRLTSPMAIQACAYHYPIGVKLLLEAEKDEDHEKAKEAYKQLDIVYKYNVHYGNTEELLKKAYALASQNVLITLDESVFEEIPEEYLFAFEVLDVMDDEWVNYYGQKEPHIDFDLEIKLDINHFRISQLKETVTTSRGVYGDNYWNVNASTEAAEIEINSILNSQGVEYSTYISSKDALLDGQLIIIDSKTDELIDTKDISFVERYSEYESNDSPYSALSAFSLTGYSKDVFGSLSIDKQMAIELIGKTKSEMINIIKKYL